MKTTTRTAPALPAYCWIHRDGGVYYASFVDVTSASSPRATLSAASLTACVAKVRRDFGGRIDFSAIDTRWV